MKTTYNVLYSARKPVILNFRNQTKYTQGKNSELRAALESARKRTEVKRDPSREDIPEETSNV